MIQIWLLYSKGGRLSIINSLVIWVNSVAIQINIISNLEELGMEGPGLTQKKKTYRVVYQNTELTLSGDFDSGNLNWAGVDQQKNEIQLQFGKDKEFKPSAKCWFHFSIEGSYNYMPVNLLLQKTNSLNAVAKIYDLYRPVVKVQGGEWARHDNPVEFEVSAENDISFRMTLELYGSRKFYVALCYPWSLTDNQQYFQEIERNIFKRKDLYYNREILIRSIENHPIHLIALSSREVYDYQPESYIQHLFPERENEAHFKMIKKPLILVTCRVHPGEIGSSYSLKGMINFLISGTMQAKKILNQFYFLFVPILNPDGVFNGNNRMDSLGQNLNRFYLFPELQKQPSCYAIKALLENTRQQLFAFFDLHGHANKKSCFLYGNSITNSRLQIESVLFAKHLSNACDFIEFKSCNFSKKQMSSKDRGQDFSKQGCARVVVHKWTNSPYCYTLETGLYKNVKVDDKGIQRYGQQFYSPKIYGEVGAKMLTSLFAILKKDKNIEQLRKEVTLYVEKLQKISSKKEINGVKGSKKQIKKVKDKKEESSVPANNSENKDVKRMQMQKQNDYLKMEERTKGVEEVLNKNKNYLLSLDDD